MINPILLRYASVTVQDNPFERDPPVFNITNHVIIPFITSGTNIFLESFTHTQTKVDNCLHVHLTLDTKWNPHTVQLASTQHMKAECDCSDTEPGLLQISSIYCLHEMTKSLMSQRNIEAVDVQERKTFISNERHTSITSDQLGHRWNIGMKQAQQTLRVTTQQGVRSAILPLSRRYRTDRMFNQKKLRNQKFYTDTLFGRCKSISSNTCAQIFANDSYFVKAYPMDQKSMAGQALQQFFTLLRSS